MVGGGRSGTPWWIAAVYLLLTFVVAIARAERINQEGRILGPAPVVTTPILFNTPQADAIVSAIQIMPVTNAWNEDISRRPAAHEFGRDDRANQIGFVADPANLAAVL